MTEITEAPERSLMDIVAMVRAHGRWLLVTTIGGIALAVIVSALMAPIYRADLSIVAVPATEPGTSPSRESLERVLGTWVYVLNDPAAFDQAARRLGEQYDFEDLRSVKVDARPIDNSMVVRVTVRARTGKLALEFAQALFDAADASEMTRPFPISQLGPPSLQPSDSPESPRRGRNVLLGGIIGFLFGTTLMFLWADRGWRPRQSQ